MSTVPQKIRQAGSLSRLQSQLASGEKTQKGTYDVKVPLTERDIKLKNKEISNLKKKL